ncbi:MAG: hypothetical protein IJL74_00240 [Bacilli bacterium]|nr:hypothetical protein [Bacilli bacterium]
MFNCPKCGGLSPIGTTVCGACGTNLENVPGNVSKNEKKDSGVILYDRDFASPTDANKVKNKYAFISPWHIIMFVASVCSYIFIPNRLIKLVIAFVFFYIAESSNRKNSAFLVLVRIVTALQILGIVIALLLRLTTSSEIMNEFFKYFKF